MKIGILRWTPLVILSGGLTAAAEREVARPPASRPARPAVAMSQPASRPAVLTVTVKPGGKPEWPRVTTDDGRVIADEAAFIQSTLTPQGRSAAQATVVIRCTQAEAMRTLKPVILAAANAECRYARVEMADKGVFTLDLEAMAYPKGQPPQTANEAANMRPCVLILVGVERGKPLVRISRPFGLLSLAPQDKLVEALRTARDSRAKDVGRNDVYLEISKLDRWTAGDAQDLCRAAESAGFDAVNWHITPEFGP
jgi:hypothetical protein